MAKGARLRFVKGGWQHYDRHHQSSPIVVSPPILGIWCEQSVSREKYFDVPVTPPRFTRDFLKNLCCVWLRSRRAHFSWNALFEVALQNRS